MLCLGSSDSRGCTVENQLLIVLLISSGLDFGFDAAVVADSTSCFLHELTEIDSSVPGNRQG